MPKIPSQLSERRASVSQKALLLTTAGTHFLRTFTAIAPNSREKSFGTIDAPMRSMTTAERFEDLIAWQLSEALKEEVFRLTQRERVARDEKFCDQIQRSARSAPANIAEGFGRYDPKPNANHVSIAKGSLEETKNHIIDGFKRNHFDLVERDDLLKLTTRALTATTRYLRYLKSCKQAPKGKPFVSGKSKGAAAPAAVSGEQELENLENRNLGNLGNLENQNPQNQ